MDGQTYDDSIYRASIASHGENKKLLYLGNGLTYHNENWQVTHINPYNPMGHQNLKFLTIQDGGWPSSLKPLNNYISATG